MVAVNFLPGLPPYGPLPAAFPARWGTSGRQGTVVEFRTADGSWVANFQPGIAGIDLAEVHPNGRDAVVVASGDLWLVNTEARTAECLLPAIDSVLAVDNPKGWVFTRQGLAFARLGPGGILWHTKRLSLDGFSQVRVEGDRIVGLAWTGIDDQLEPFEVELSTGRSRGGGFANDDIEGWQRIANLGGGGDN
jgi:hypothetical protein